MIILIDPIFFIFMIYKTVYYNGLVNVNPHAPPQGNYVGHRWGISGDLSIEQAQGGGGLANFGFVLINLVDKLWDLWWGF